MDNETVPGVWCTAGGPATLFWHHAAFYLPFLGPLLVVFYRIVRRLVSVSAAYKYVSSLHRRATETTRPVHVVEKSAPLWVNETESRNDNRIFDPLCQRKSTNHEGWV